MDQRTIDSDVHRSPSERAARLLAEMTVEEKAQQVSCLMPTSLATEGVFDRAKASSLSLGIGGIAPYMTEDPNRLVGLHNAIQRHLVRETRLGIPAIFHSEALSGVNAAHHPIFPTGIALASSWSPDLVEEMTEAVRRHMMRLGIRQALSPVLDVAFDPRWGRVHETYGEDPMLVAALGVAFVRGLQGEDLADGVIATAKHFLGYGLAQGGLNTAAFDGGERFIRDVLAFPTEAAIGAGLRSVMNSYGDVDGIPAGLSKRLLTGLLRDELGFEGLTVSDYMTLNAAIYRQGVAESPAEVARYALRAGLDMELPTIFAYGEILAKEVHRGRIPVDDLDRATLRVLTAKYELGLFENPYVSDEPIVISAATAHGAGTASELARRSVVLLQNDGILPLKAGVKLALIGPHAENARYQIATYTHPSNRELYRFMATGHMGNMVGTDAFTSEPESEATAHLDAEAYIRLNYGTLSLAEELQSIGFDVTTVPGSGVREPLGGDAIGRAVAVARDADIVILALGGYSAGFGSDHSEGEGTDTADTALPDVQRHLAEAVAALGKPVVSVVVQGRPYVLPRVVLDSAALVIASFGGQAGNAAIARTLAGLNNPSGKLPYSIARHAAQIPVYHYQKLGSGYRADAMGPGTHYIDMAATPQFAFGAGLSYTTFEFSDFSVTQEIETTGIAQVQVTVGNTGGRSGAEIVQLYANVHAAVVTRPAQQLIGFCRVELEPHSHATVTFSLPADVFAFSGIDHQVAVESANVDIYVGHSSDRITQSGQLKVVGPREILRPGKRRFLPDATIEFVSS